MNVVKYLENETQNIFCGNDISKETFNHIERVHDWRKYIPLVLQNIWTELSKETRLALLIMAEEISDNKEWE